MFNVQPKMGEKCKNGRIFYFVKEFYIDKRAGKIKRISIDFACTFVNIEFIDKIKNPPIK